MIRKSEVEWREVLDGYYEVNIFGDVRRAKKGKSTFPGKILKRINHGTGYQCYRLWKDGKCHNRFIHSLVAVAFVGPRPDGLVVNHKDHNRINNHYSNLEYITPAENNRHAFTRSGEEHHNSKLKNKDIANIRELASNGMKQVEIAKIYGVSKSNISCVVTFKSWKNQSSSLPPRR